MVNLVLCVYNVRMKIIIVHINERSLDESVSIAQKQGDVHLVSERPFAASLRRAFAMAVNKKWEWLVVMGGDQFLKDEAIQRLQEHSLKANNNIFRISGYGYDHLLMRNRMMAPSIYRVSLLGKALKINTGNRKQPESHVLYMMKKIGYPFTIIKDILAVHDEQQYYRDIYRKGYFEASKFIEYIKKENIINDLEVSSNPDHKIFLLGVNDFMNNTKRTPQEALDLCNLTEKE